MHFLFITAGILGFLFLAGFAVTSFIENELRAGSIAGITAMIFAGGFSLFGLLLPQYTMHAGIAIFGFAFLTTLFLSLPVGSKKGLLVKEDEAEKFDERHIMFARQELEKGSKNFEKYYSELNPEAREEDEKIMQMPGLGREGGKYYNPRDPAYFRAVFDFIERSRDMGDENTPLAPEVNISPKEATLRIKKFARHMGAEDVGITELKEYHKYSHVGRNPEKWGQKIELNHRYAIAFTVEMDYRMIRTAPIPSTTTETAIGYMRAQDIAISLSMYCRTLGYDSRPHFDANYQVLCTAVAQDAGLGEIGRLGILITPKHGPRVRIAVVTTDLPLESDNKTSFGVQDFCEFCKKCAENCPSQAIEKGGKKKVRGCVKWQSSQEKCFKLWRRFGTDCAVCISVCPYSKPNTFFHNIVRFFISRNSLARRIALFMDDIFYGRKPASMAPPDWFEDARA